MEKRKMFGWIVDVLIYAIIIIAWRFVDESVPKSQRAFLCGDPTLSLPFKRNTIRGIWLHGTFYGAPTVVWFIELVLYDGNTEKGFDRFKVITMKAITWFKDYFITFISLIILTSTTKNLIGSYRPHFFDLCRPDTSNCTIGGLVVDFKCTNSNASSYLLFESSRSFPSGHVISVVYPCLFLMLYLQSRSSRVPSKLFIPFFQLILLLWMTIVSITRLTDNSHHLLDIISGAMIASAFVIYAVKLLCKDFHFCDAERELVKTS